MNRGRVIERAVVRKKGSLVWGLETNCVGGKETVWVRAKYDVNKGGSCGLL